MVIVAAGRSLRYGGDKLMTPIAGRPLLAHTIAAVIDHVDRCVVVCREDQVTTVEGLGFPVAVTVGGESRTASEIAGLDVVGPGAYLIGIHDGARPLVTGELLDRLYEAAAEVGGAVPVVDPRAPLVERATLMPVTDARYAQTPQVFRAGPLLDAYRQAVESGFEGHDTAAVVQTFVDVEVRGVPGDPSNIKVTTPADMESVRSVLEPSRNETR